MPAPTRPPARRAAAKPISTATRGATAGLARMKQEEEKAAQRKEANKLAGGQPFRFFVPVGETREVVIIDEEPAFFRNEHSLKNPRTGRFDLFTPCIDDVANCPVCASSGKPGYFALYLTIIDLTPFTTNDGDDVEWSKKLMVVKLTQQKKIARLYEREGSLRGMVIACTRDGDKDAAIGNDIEFVEWMDEDTLELYVNEYTDRENKVHQVIGSEVFDYDEIFPELTEDQLITVAGGGERGHSVGNRRDDDRALGRSGNDRRPARNSRRDADDGDAGDAPSRPARGAGTRAAAPAARSAPRRQAAAEEPAEAPARRAAPARRPAAVEQEDPPQRAARPAPRTAAPAARPAPRRPVRGESPLPDDEPAAPTDRSSRRANLRGAR